MRISHFVLRPVWLGILLPLFVASSGADDLATAEPLARRSVMVGDHRMTLVRIRAPRLAPVLPAPVMAEVPSAEALEAEERREAKVSAFASLTVTVYPGPITEIVWKHQERSFRAYSNVDFRHLGGLSEIETDSAVLSWFCVPMEGESDGLAPELCAQLGLSAKFAEYVVDASEEEMATAPEAFAVLDAIHDYFGTHRAQLHALYVRRQAEALAREAAASAQRQSPPDTTVYFWRLNN